jgi:hypothetical protein
MSILTQTAGGAAVLKVEMTHTVLNTKTRQKAPRPCGEISAVASGSDGDYWIAVQTVGRVLTRGRSRITEI